MTLQPSPASPYPPTQPLPPSRTHIRTHHARPPVVVLEGLLVQKGDGVVGVGHGAAAPRQVRHQPLRRGGGATAGARLEAVHVPQGRTGGQPAVGVLPPRAAPKVARRRAHRLQVRGVHRHAGGHAAGAAHHRQHPACQHRLEHVPPPHRPPQVRRGRGHAPRERVVPPPRRRLQQAAVRAAPAVVRRRGRGVARAPQPYRLCSGGSGGGCGARPRRQRRVGKAHERPAGRSTRRAVGGHVDGEGAEGQRHDGCGWKGRGDGVC